MGRSRETCNKVSPRGFRKTCLCRSRETYGQPDNLVGVDGVPSAPGVLLVTDALDDDRVLEGSW